MSLLKIHSIRTVRKPHAHDMRAQADLHRERVKNAARILQDEINEKRARRDGAFSCVEGIT